MPVEFYLYLIAGALAGGFINGLACFKRLSTDHFQRLIIFMMLISGAALLIRGVI